MRKYNEAKPYLEKSLKVVKKLNEPSMEEALALHHFAIYYQFKSNLRGALESYSKALDIHKKILPNDHASLADSYLKVAYMLGWTGKYDKALEHLALHGEVNHKDPKQSKLYFTKVKDSIEDNYLYAHELFTLKLPAELAVLSACETGSGEIATGEGIMSIGNAFQYAGTKSLLLSSWKVSDQVAPELMKLFYQNLENGLTKPKALQKAKLDYLENTSSIRANPFYWGSFYIIGDISPIDIGGNNTFAFLGITLLILGIIGFFLLKHFRKKR